VLDCGSPMRFPGRLAWSLIHQSLHACKRRLARRTVKLSADHGNQGAHVWPK
jgi:hypothetical protein